MLDFNHRPKIHEQIGALIDAAWPPAQLYMAYGLTFVAAAVIVLLHRLQAPVNSTESALTPRAAH